MSNAPIEEVITRSERFRRRRNAFDRWQRWFLILGALIDGLVGSLLYSNPRRTTQMLHLIVPREGEGQIWAQLVGMLLLTMAMVYLYASLDPDRHLGIVVISAIGRLWAVVFYLYYVLILGAPPMFLAFVGLDGMMCLLHVWALGPDRFRRAKDAFEYQTL